MSIDIIAAYWALVLALLGAMLLLLVINLCTFPRLRPCGAGDACAGARQAEPLLSILVPARNEETVIEGCVRSLLGQTYERMEVIVLDDGSSDGTGARVQAMIEALPPAQSARLRLLRGEALPPGWMGKNFACQQLAQHARGQYLLFTDADTLHAPTTASAVISCMRHYGVGLLSAQPAFELGSLGERLVVPLLNFTIMTLLPVALIRLRPEASLATGNGQLLTFARPTYDKVGGHAAVKGSVLEDVLLARAVKAAGERMIFVDALQFVRCRMYRSLAEVWSGFSKNLFAFYNYKLPFALLALALNVALFIVPPFAALAALLLRLPSAAILPGTAAYALAVVMRVLLALRFTSRRRASALLAACLLCLLHPLALGLECLILLNSIRWHYRKRGVIWKERQYAGH